MEESIKLWRNGIREENLRNRAEFRTKLMAMKSLSEGNAGEEQLFSEEEKITGKVKPMGNRLKQCLKKCIIKVARPD